MVATRKTAENRQMTGPRASLPRTYALEFDDTRFEVNPGAGARITSFSLNGANVLSGPGIHRDNYGSTLWTSPQSDWGWPPPPEFDERAYSVLAGAGTLTLIGPSNFALGIRLEKRFAVERARAAISIEYSIHNIGSVPKAYAPWEVSRVHPGGLTFFPTGDRGAGSLGVEQRGGITWYAHAPETLDEKGKKHSADGKDGYIAHAAQGILFVKTFSDLPPERQAPGEGEVEVYANSRYVEVEAQGPYSTIEPGAAARWTVRWYVRALDRGAAVIGGSRLQELISAILRGERS